MTLGVLAVLSMMFVMFSGFWTDWLWYRSVDYSSVFTTTLWTKIGLFAVFGLLMATAVGVNIWLAHRLRPPLSAMSLEQQSLDRYRMGIAPYKKWVLLAITALVGLIAGASATSQWRTWLMWVNGVSFGQKDPQFQMDVAFYAFDLPWYRFLLGFGFAAVVLSLIAAALTHYLYGGLRITSPGARATAAATGHLSVLLGLFVALKAVAYWLDRYGLAVKSSDFKATDNWTGLRRHLRAALLRDAVAPHLAAAGDRLRPDGPVGDPDRRPVPGHSAEVPGPAERAGQGSAVHREEHRGDAQGLRHRRGEARGLHRQGRGQGPGAAAEERRRGRQLPHKRPEHRLADVPAAGTGAEVLPVPLHLGHRPVRRPGHDHRSA
jgi:hypothetical protein